MEVTLSLALPRDHLSVPLARRILRSSLETLGIDSAAIGDIELAMTEACTNVLDHSNAEDVYEVTAGIHGRTCVIEVIDKGMTFDGSATGIEEADRNAESGRGIQLMRALMDRLEFHDRPTQGTVVHLEKHLTFAADSPIGRLEGTSA
jgi:serine/threonine-protein kinase RsbW